MIYIKVVFFIALVAWFLYYCMKKSDEDPYFEDPAGGEHLKPGRYPPSTRGWAEKKEITVIASVTEKTTGCLGMPKDQDMVDQPERESF